MCYLGPMTYKITIEATEEALQNKDVEYALNDLSVALGDSLISWLETEGDTIDYE